MLLVDWHQLGKIALLNSMRAHAHARAEPKSFTAVNIKGMSKQCSGEADEVRKLDDDRQRLQSELEELSNSAGERQAQLQSELDALASKQVGVVHDSAIRARVMSCFL
eukprot:4817122-Amphidinium_carterae.1